MVDMEELGTICFVEYLSQAVKRICIHKTQFYI